MNVADLLDDSPSDKRRQPQRDLQPQSQSQRREPSRERPSEAQQQLPHPPPHPHPHSLPAQLPYPPQHPSRNARNLSPPREYSREYPPNHPPQRLPAIIDFPDSYDKPRRPVHDPLPPPPLPHEIGIRQQHPPQSSSMGTTGEYLALCRTSLVPCRSRVDCHAPDPRDNLQP